MTSLLPGDLLGRPLNEFEKKNAPNQLYVEGPMNIPLRSRRVSVVGTRRPTEEGMEEAPSRDGVACRWGSYRGERFGPQA